METHLLFAKCRLLKPYGDIAVEKLECIGHVQKRVGTRCRNMRDQYRGKKLADNKPLTGKGRLTEKAINTLQNYYGMAIRQNLHDEYIMRKCIWAALYHNCDIRMKMNGISFAQGLKIHGVCGGVTN